MIDLQNLVYSKTYICADGRCLNPSQWLRLPPTQGCPYGSIGKFRGVYTSLHFGRMCRFINWRPLGKDGQPLQQQNDSFFIKLDAIDDKDWSDILERSWFASKPSARKKRTGTSVVPFRREARL